MNFPDRQSPSCAALSTIKNWLFGILLAIPIVVAALALMLYAANVPIGDDYDAILNYLNHPDGNRLLHLFDFHNEHRIVATRLVAEFLHRLNGAINFKTIMWIGNVGWWLYALLLAHRFVKSGLERVGAVFATWMLVGFIDQENALWAMTSIQNHWVLLFAFGSCLCFAKRERWAWFAGALALAVCATFTSGSGLLIFPALALMAVCDHMFHRKTTFFSLTFKQWCMLCIFMVTFLVVAAFYFHGMPHEENPDLTPPEDPVLRIKTAAGFFFAFFANAIPWVKLAIPAGVLVFLTMLVVSTRIARMCGVSLAMFAFMAFNVASVLAATVFRASRIDMALPGRYRTVSVSIIVTLLYLFLAEMNLPGKMRKALCVFGMAGALLVFGIYTIRGVNYNAANKVVLENGLKQWPGSTEGLACHDAPESRAHCNAILAKSNALGIYRPSDALKQ